MKRKNNRVTELDLNPIKTLNKSAYLSSRDCNFKGKGFECRKCISFQFSLMCSSQLRPNSEGPSPSTTNKGKSQNWPLYDTFGVILPRTSIFSPEYVFKSMFDTCIGGGIDQRDKYVE